MSESKVISVVPTYTYKEVFEKCMNYFNNDELAASTWINKYALKNAEGKFTELTPDDMHSRMAKEFARKENEYSSKLNINENFKHLSKYGQEREPLNETKIVDYFKNFKYIIPQGSVMSS